MESCNIILADISYTKCYYISNEYINDRVTALFFVDKNKNIISIPDNAKLYYNFDETKIIVPYKDNQRYFVTPKDNIIVEINNIKWSLSSYDFIPNIVRQLPF